TGSTGSLTAKYLAPPAPDDLRWALAATNRRKLEGASDRLARNSERHGEPSLLDAAAGDAAAVRERTESAQVAITTGRPYLHYGRVAGARRKSEARPQGRKVKGIVGKPSHEGELGAWVIPFPSIDPQVITRSGRALDRYGPEFSYGHYLHIKRLPVAAGLLGG